MLAIAALAMSAAPQNANATASALVDAIAHDDFAKAESLFDDKMQSAAPEAKVASMWRDTLAQAGALVAVDAAILAPSDAKLAAKHLVRVIVPVVFARAIVDIGVTVDAAGKVTGFHFVKWKPPQDVVERNLEIGSDPWKLGATVAEPATSTTTTPKLVAVVLVAGSGPNDRDENIEANHPLRDLAWGLAQRGIASIRFDKRTKTHGKDVVKNIATFTLREEEIDDAVTAFDAVRSQPEIDPARVYVVGHSLGGYCAPRIAAAANAAGLVSLAGPSRRFGDVVLDQVKHAGEAKLGVFSFLNEPAVWQAERQAAHLADRKWVDDHDADDVIAGAVAKAYWLDDMDHDPVALAKTLSVPMLFLQGEADWQVLLKDLDGWRAALSSHENVTFKSYPGLNHLFLASTVDDESDYRKPGSVDPKVIDDIAHFVR